MGARAAGTEAAAQRKEGEGEQRGRARKRRGGRSKGQQADSVGRLNILQLLNSTFIFHCECKPAYVSTCDVSHVWSLTSYKKPHAT